MISVADFDYVLFVADPNPAPSDSLCLLAVVVLQVPVSAQVLAADATQAGRLLGEAVEQDGERLKIETNPEHMGDIVWFFGRYNADVQLGAYCGKCGAAVHDDRCSGCKTVFAMRDFPPPIMKRLPSWLVTQLKNAGVRIPAKA